MAHAECREAPPARRKGSSLLLPSQLQFSRAERYRSPPSGELGRAWGREFCRARRDLQSHRLQLRIEAARFECRAAPRGRAADPIQVVFKCRGISKGDVSPPWIIFLPTFWIMPKSRGHRGLSGGEERESFNPQSSTAPQAKRKRFSRTESPPGSRVKSAARFPPIPGGNATEDRAHVLWSIPDGFLQGRNRGGGSGGCSPESSTYC